MPNGQGGTGCRDGDPFLILRKRFTLAMGDNVAIMARMKDNSIDATITDPPYGMDMAAWDHDVPPVETWREVYRVMKPGAFIASFCSPEYYHQMAVKIDAAGFKPVTMFMWMVTTKMAKANRVKEAFEPIYIGQKPLDGTLKANVAKWGTGKIDTDTTRVPWDKAPPKGWVKGGHSRRAFGGDVAKAADDPNREYVDADPRGRYPTNIVGLLDDPDHQKYFYAPRVTRKERGEGNDHPTPKPVALMRHLVKLYAPQGGMVFDPFMGSGSTGIAALLEGREFFGVDNCDKYVHISEQRINEWTNAPCQTEPDS